MVTVVNVGWSDCVVDGRGERGEAKGGGLGSNHVRSLTTTPHHVTS